LSHDTTTTTNTGINNSNLSRLIETPPPTPSKFTLRKTQTNRRILTSDQQSVRSYGAQSRNSSLNSQTNDSDSNHEILHAELFKRLNHSKIKNNQSVMKRISRNIDSNSKPDEIKEFLITKEFSNK
jgi:hypothetical protein